MGRFNDVWYVFWNGVPADQPPVEVIKEIPVIGNALVVTLYEAKNPRYSTSVSPWIGNKYLTCEQAHSECPGAEVSTLQAIAIADKYFRTYECVKVQPKPKKAKGRA